MNLEDVAVVQARDDVHLYEVAVKTDIKVWPEAHFGDGIKKI